MHDDVSGDMDTLAVLLQQTMPDTRWQPKTCYATTIPQLYCDDALQRTIDAIV